MFYPVCRYDHWITFINLVGVHLVHKYTYLILNPLSSINNDLNNTVYFSFIKISLTVLSQSHFNRLRLLSDNFLNKLMSIVTNLCN